MVFTHKIAEVEKLVHDLLNLAIGDETDDMLRGPAHNDSIHNDIIDSNLAQALELGAGWVHAAMSAKDCHKVK